MIGTPIRRHHTNIPCTFRVPFFLEPSTINLFPHRIAYIQTTNEMDNSSERTSEKPGEITSDSLAAESLASGGDFADGDATASGVPSGSTTANVTDDSGASILSAAPDAQSRGDRFEGTTDFAPAPSAGSGSGDGAYDAERGAPAQNVDTAPSYVDAQLPDGALKPKGKNLTEGGAVDVDAPNASFNDEIGTKNDPGRLAEADFQKMNARAGADAGYDGVGGTGNVGKEGQGGYEQLGLDESA